MGEASHTRPSSILSESRHAGSQGHSFLQLDRSVYKAVLRRILINYLSNVKALLPQKIRRQVHMWLSWSTLAKVLNSWLNRETKVCHACQNQKLSFYKLLAN